MPPTKSLTAGELQLQQSNTHVAVDPQLLNVAVDPQLLNAQAAVEPQSQSVMLPGQQNQGTGFPLFKNFPAEVQTMIFTQAIGKPNLQVVKATRVVDTTTGDWYLKFSPVAKGSDTSGFRRVLEIALVNRRAYAAVRLATQKYHARLPFKNLNARIDGAEDLVLVEMPNAQPALFGNFHPMNQITNPANWTFAAGDLVAGFANIRKVALRFADWHIFSSRWNANFRCVYPTGKHAKHQFWRMCPEELCGFLNCFTSLREFYLIHDRPRCNYNKSLFTTYIKSLYTCEFIFFSVSVCHFPFVLNPSPPFFSL